MLIVVYAGANGAGKSTLFSSLKEELGLPFINPDMIARENFAEIVDEEERYREYAMPFAQELRSQYIIHKNDFSFETVLSHSSKIAELAEAKNLGYEIYSIYIGTNDPSINIERVANRVGSGGHDVPEGKITQRYYKSLDNLPELLNLSTEAVVIDNSNDGMVEVLYKCDNRYFLLIKEENIPEWINKYIVEPLIAKGYINQYPDYLEEQPDRESLFVVVKSATQKLIKNENDLKKQ